MTGKKRWKPDRLAGAAGGAAAAADRTAQFRQNIRKPKSARTSAHSPRCRWWWSWRSSKTDGARAAPSPTPIPNPLRKERNRYRSSSTTRTTRHSERQTRTEGTALPPAGAPPLVDPLLLRRLPPLQAAPVAGVPPRGSDGELWRENARGGSGLKFFPWARSCAAGRRRRTCRASRTARKGCRHYIHACSCVA